MIIPASHTPLLLIYALAQGLAASTLLRKLRLQKTAAGVSYQTLLALAIGHICAFVFSLALPTSVSTVAYGVSCLLSAICLSILIRVAFCNFPSSYQSQNDSFGRRLIPFSTDGTGGSIRSELSPGSMSREKAGEKWSSILKPHWGVVYLLAFGMATCIETFRVHKTINVLLSTLGSFADCLLGLAILPQLSMMFRAEKTHVARAIGEAVVYWTIARAASLIFWAFEAQIPNRGVKLVIDPLNLLSLIYIAYYYRLSKKQQLSPQQQQLTPLPI